MPVEVFLLLILGGLTLLGYMVAINAHGPVRLSFSYLIATIMLVVTVYASVQYVNIKDFKRQQDEVARLEAEKQQVKDEAAAKVEVLEVDRQKVEAAARINAYVAEGAAIAGQIAGADLADNNLDFDALLNRAAATSSRAAQFRKKLSEIEPDLVRFPESAPSIRQAADQLVAAGNNYRLYYHAEDAGQEAERGRLLVSNARAAGNLLRDVAAKLATSVQ